MRFLFIPIILMSFSLSAHGVGVDKDRLQDPKLEAKAQQLMKQLRCLVCQNQSIVDSDAALAKDLRAIVREQVSAGKSEQKILEFMTERYGDWILLKPPFNVTTVFLWFGPVALLLIGGILVFRAARKMPPGGRPAPLTPAEEKRLDKIMGGRGKT